MNTPSAGHPDQDETTVWRDGSRGAQNAQTASDPRSPDHVCTAACTHDVVRKGTLRTTNAPTRVGDGSPRAR
jgi:hypothetical protein